jgi:hypothetical protein
LSTRLRVAATGAEQVKAQVGLELAGRGRYVALERDRGLPDAEYGGAVLAATRIARTVDRDLRRPLCGGPLRIHQFEVVDRIELHLARDLETRLVRIRRTFLGHALRCDDRRSFREKG